MKNELSQKIIKILLEEFPTNAMGTSSSISGTGNIDTFDPLLLIKMKKKMLKRKNPISGKD